VPVSGGTRTCATRRAQARPAARRGPVKVAWGGQTGTRSGPTRVGRARKPGPHAAVWDGADETGQTVASRVCLYRLGAGAQQAVGRLTFASWAQWRRVNAASGGTAR
jgi:hypothetical protein